MPLVLTDYQVFRKVSIGTSLNASQPFEIDCDPVPQDSIWRVDQIACVINPQGAAAGAPPINGPIQVTLFDQSNPGPTAIPIQATTMAQYPVPGNPQEVWADWDAEAGPFTILGGQQLAVVFAFCPIGASAAIRVQYGLFMGTPGQATPVAGAQPNPVPVNI